MQTLIQEMKEQSADLAGLLSPFCQLSGDLLRSSAGCAAPQGLPGTGMLQSAQNKHQSCAKKQPALDHNILPHFLGVLCRLHRLGTENHWEMSLISLLFKMISPAFSSQLVIKNYSPPLNSKGRLKNYSKGKLSYSEGFSLLQEEAIIDLFGVFHSGS